MGNALATEVHKLLSSRTGTLFQRDCALGNLPDSFPISGHILS